MDCFHSDGVLHRDGRDGRSCIAPQCRDSLYVGLYSGTAAAIASGYGEYSSIVFHTIKGHDAIHHDLLLSL